MAFININFFSQFQQIIQYFSIFNLNKTETFSNQKMTYSRISYQERVKLIKLVLEKKNSIKKAAETLEIKLSTAKEIVRKYKYKGKITKKQSQNHNVQITTLVQDESNMEQINNQEMNEENQRINECQQNTNNFFNYQEFWYNKMVQHYYHMQMNWSFNFYQLFNAITQY